MSLMDRQRFSFVNPTLARTRENAATRTSQDVDRNLSFAGVAVEPTYQLPETHWAERMFQTLRENAHGQVGVTYGRFLDGKVSGDVLESYIFGSTGTDKFQISVGATFQESNLKYKGRRR